MRLVQSLLVAAALLLARYAAGQTLAPTPPMGWNSWDAYGLTIDEAQFRDNVAVLVKSLKPFGYTYAVIDEGWFLKNPLDRPTPEKLQYEIDGNGRYLPVPARFPSAVEAGANTGFRALGASLHAQGLQFGIHIVRGIPRVAVAQNLPIAGSPFHAEDAADQSDACPWDPTNWGIRDTPAGQAWYDSLLRQYADWGVDYLKVDCISSHPYKPAEIRMIHRAIVKTGRPIVLSLSPGPTALSDAAAIQPLAQMWRISDDIWDYWSNRKPWPRSVRDQFDLLAAWAPYAGPGSWPDADMLPLGYLGPHPGEGNPRPSRLTPDEQRTLLTLWSVARSPLIVGANLTRLDPATLALLTNPAVLALDQHSRNGRTVSREGDLIAWTAEGDSSTRYLALFNLGEEPLPLEKSYADYSLPGAPLGSRELWTGTEAAPAKLFHVTLPPHGCVLYQLRPAAKP